jgi:hypothetical protein
MDCMDVVSHRMLSSGFGVYKARQLNWNPDLMNVHLSNNPRAPSSEAADYICLCMWA